MEAADSQYKGMDTAAIPSILVYAYIQTGMLEEIPFRGFLLKKLASKFGFVKGNIIQAAIFGVTHFLMVWGNTDFIADTVIVIYSMIVAIALSYINKRISDGSILPSWVIHGLLHTIEGISMALLR